MTKEQIDEIALRVAKLHFSKMECEMDSKYHKAFTHALLAELAKVSEPVAYGVLEKDDMFETWDFIASWPEAAHEHIDEVVNEWLNQGDTPPAYSVIPLYTNPQLPQPDLVAEIERLREELKLSRQGAEHCFQQMKDADANADVQVHARKYFEQQLSAAQADNEQLVQALDTYNNAVSALHPVDLDTPIILLKVRRDARKAIAAHKARQQGKEQS